ncbi:MAG: sulfur carrier protein ThiS [Acinetobacter sp.]|nr:MAG: sulfur carrier protein ThiS [Acinetobacter sp.]
MTIYLNGEQLITSCQTLWDLVQQLDLIGKRFAVEVNQQIIPKSRLTEMPIQPNDRIEIIHAVGGG